MSEYLREIPGPEFLGIYLVTIILSYILYRVFLVFSETTRNNEILPQSNINPLEIAVLKGKGNVIHVIKTLLIGLYAKKILTLQEDGNISRTNVSDLKSLSESEKIIYKFYSKPQAAINIFKDNAVKKSLLIEIYFIKEKLKEQCFLKPNHLLTKQRIAYIIIWLFVVAIGSIKLRMGILYDKPYGFLIGLIVLSVILYAFSFPRPTAQLGKKYLKHLAKRYSEIKNADPNYTVFPTNMDPALTCALFGMGALFLFPEFSAFGKQFPIQTYSDSGCTSCSTSSSGCSSCSSGSDGGGGGCGGCGGGGD